jgi:hypothetical protein
LQAFEDFYLSQRPTLDAILTYSNYFFAVIFGLEFLLKLIGYGVVGYFTSFWNLLDVFIVAVSVSREELVSPSTSLPIHLSPYIELHLHLILSLN